MHLSLRFWFHQAITLRRNAVSKKRQPANKGKRRITSKTQPDWVHRIFLAARSAAKQVQQHDDFDPMDESESRLADLVARALDTGTDKHVLRAIADLEEAHCDDAAEMVADWAEDAASTLPVMVQQIGGVAGGELELFLAPVLLMVDAGHAAALRLPDWPPDDPRSPLNLCATSLRRYGLIGEEPSVAALPWLYAISDLPVTWSGQRGMLRQFLAAISGQPARLPQTRQTDAVTQPTIALRFVLFAIVSSLDDDRAGPLYDGRLLDPENREDSATGPAPGTEADPRMLAWQEDFGHILTECLPGVLSAQVGIPAWWNDAIHAGIDMRNLSGLITAADPDGNPNTMRATHAAMGFYLVEDELELRIGITRDGKFTGTFVWTCHQDPEDEVDEAFQALEYIGVPPEQIHFATDILGDERCPDCGKPFFPSVSGGSMHEQMDESDQGGHGPRHGGSGHSRLH